MRRIACIVLSIAWALWFGGLVMLFMAVSSIFKTFANDRATAGRVASRIFQISGTYQLILAGVSIIAACLGAGRSVTKVIFVSLLVWAAGGGVVIGLFLTPRIEALREQGLTALPEFGRLHGVSMTIFLAETALLLIAGFLMPSFIAGSTRSTLSSQMLEMS